MRFSTTYVCLPLLLSGRGTAVPSFFFLIEGETATPFGKAYCGEEKKKNGPDNKDKSSTSTTAVLQEMSNAPAPAGQNEVRDLAPRRPRVPSGKRQVRPVAKRHLRVAK